MAFRCTHVISGLRSAMHRDVADGMYATFYSVLKGHSDDLRPFGARFAFQPKSKLKRKATEVPGYRIGVTKAWDTWHTGCVVGSEDASERLMDDIMVRKFIEGVFYELLVSDIVIKRRDNQIIVAFISLDHQWCLSKPIFLLGSVKDSCQKCLGVSLN